MPLHQFGLIPVDHWDGPPPPLIYDQLTESVRPGVDGIAHALAGRWLQPFDVALTVYRDTYEDAFYEMEAQRAMVGGAWGVIYNNVNYLLEFQHVYRALSCEVVELRKIVRFVSYDRNLLYPTKLVTRWRLSPISLEGLT